MRTLKDGVPVHLTVLAFALLFIFGWLISAMTSTTNAHTASTYYAHKWNVDVNWGIGERDAPLNTTDAFNSILTGDDEWNNASGVWLDFTYQGQNTGLKWVGSACTTVPVDGWLWVITYSISALGEEHSCFSGTIMHKSVILLDDTRSDWYTGSGTPPAGQYDLRSAIVHEFGHGGGFGSGSTAHFSSTDICSGSTRQTMCSTLPAATTYKRDLEIHDEHTFDLGY